ncbi:MAG: hypothetical protein JEZ00_15700 [Anaerolineaceae bacterium]|nr:hypothetical protein [Anaerolineaceae bacterium]
MSAEWIMYKGKKILYVNYGGLSPAEMLEQILSATKMIVDENSDQILSLSDVTDCFVNKEFTDLSKKQGAISLPLTKKAAIVGVTGIKNILLKGVNAFTNNPRVPFDMLEEAKDWLVE